MLKITQKASLVIAEYCQDKAPIPIRIYLKTGGCGIPSLGLKLEQAQATDEQFEIDGFTYTIERSLLARFGPIMVDSDGFSFRISGNGIRSPIGCGTCGFACGARRGNQCTGVCFRCKTPCRTGQRIRERRKKQNQ